METLYKTLQEQHSALEQAHSSAFGSLQKVEAEQADSEEARKKLADELQAAQAELKSVTSEVPELRSQSDEQQEKLQSLQLQHQEATQSAQALKASLGRAEEKHNEELQRALQSCEDAEAKLKHLQGVEARLASALQDLTSREVGDSQRATGFEEAQKRTAVAEQRCKEAEQQNAALQQDIERLTLEASSLQQKVVQLIRIAEKAKGEVQSSAPIQKHLFPREQIATHQ